MSFLPSASGEGEEGSTPGICAASRSRVECESESAFFPVENVVWDLTEEEIGDCANAETGDSLVSRILQVSSGPLFSIKLYPKGCKAEYSGFVSLFFRFSPDLNKKVAGIESCVVNFTLKFNGKGKTSDIEFNEGKTSHGFYKVTRSPSFSPGSKFTVELRITVLKVSKSGIGKALALSAADWFKALPNAEYCEALQREGYDTIAAIRLLDDEELQRIGVTRAGHRRVILKAVKDLSKEE